MLNSSTCPPLEVVQVVCLDGVGTIINLGKVNTVPCMYTALSLSLG